MEQPLSFTFICPATENYLDITELLYYEYKQKPSREYHQLLFRAFEGLAKLLSSAAVTDFCLGDYQRLNLNFFRLIFSFLAVEQPHNRLTLYKIVIASIEILRSQQVDMGRCFDKAHYCFLAK